MSHPHQPSLPFATKPTVHKVLVIRTGALGDVIHASAAVRQIYKRFPSVEIHWVTTALYQPLVARFEGVHRVWTLDKQSGWNATMNAVLQLADALRNAGIDGVVNLQPNLKSFLLSAAVLKEKVIHPSHAAVYYKEKLELPAMAKRQVSRRHAVQDFYEPVKRLFRLSPLPASQLMPHFAVTQSATAKPGIHIALLPGVGGKRPNRQWPMTYSSELMAMLTETLPLQLGQSVAWHLVGGADEVSLAETLVRQVQKTAPNALVYNHCGQNSVLETAQLLAECHLVVGGDTGPLHLAAAVGTPILGIYAPTDVRRTGPIGPQWIQTLTPDPKKTCWPCERPVCFSANNPHLTCTADISVAKAIDLVQAFCRNLGQQSRLNGN